MQSAVWQIGLCRTRLPTRWHLVRIILAIVFITAAVLKIHGLVTQPVVVGSLLESRWVLIGTAEFELLFGIWLFTDMLPMATWCLALACCGTFASISLYKALSGQSTCGCFGRVSLSPWYSGMIDMALVVLLLIWRPNIQKRFFNIRSKETSIPLIFVLITWIAISFPTVIAMGKYTPAVLLDGGDAIGVSKIIDLKPQLWIGRQFPLFNYTTASNEKLKQGKWFALLYHEECPVCQKVIQELPRIILPMGIQNIALIEMPPYNYSSELLDPINFHVTRERLNNNHEWLVETPLAILLDGGIVVEILNKKDLVDLLPHIATQ